MVKRSRIEFDDCMKQGLLRKVVPSTDKAEKGIEKAMKFLEQGRKAFDAGAFDSCLLTCYQAIFMSAKSVLFKDGYREKSHACVARYIASDFIEAMRKLIKIKTENEVKMYEKKQK